MNLVTCGKKTTKATFDLACEITLTSDPKKLGKLLHDQRASVLKFGIHPFYHLLSKNRLNKANAAEYEKNVCCLFNDPVDFNNAYFVMENSWPLRAEQIRRIFKKNGSVFAPVEDRTISLPHGSILEMTDTHKLIKITDEISKPEITVIFRFGLWEGENGCLANFCMNMEKVIREAGREDVALVGNPRVSKGQSDLIRLVV